MGSREVDRAIEIFRISDFSDQKKPRFSEWRLGLITPPTSCRRMDILSVVDRGTRAIQTTSQLDIEIICNLKNTIQPLSGT
jgi:hypothetical protein